MLQFALVQRCAPAQDAHSVFGAASPLVPIQFGALGPEFHSPTPRPGSNQMIHRQRFVAKPSEPHRILSVLGLNKAPRHGGALAARDTVERIRRGFPPSVIPKAAAYFDLAPAEIERVIGLSNRQIARLSARGIALTTTQSDRIYRFVRIGLLAEDLLENRHDANRWLRRPARALGDIAPIDFLDTDAGARAVELLVGRLANGIVT